MITPTFSWGSAAGSREDTPLVPIRVDPPAGVRLADTTPPEVDFSAKLDAMARLGRLAELDGLVKRRAAMEKLDEMRSKGLEMMKRQAAVSPVDAVELKGAEAERVIDLAREIAKSHGHAMPVGKDQTTVFSRDGFTYTVYGDGRVTRSKAGVPTPEQHQGLLRMISERQAALADSRAEMSALDRVIEAMRDELGPIDADEMANLRSKLGDFSV